MYLLFSLLLAIAMGIGMFLTIDDPLTLFALIVPMSVACGALGSRLQFGSVQSADAD